MTQLNSFRIAVEGAFAFNPSVNSREPDHNLPEPKQIQGNQQVQMKRDESDIPSLLSFCPLFAAMYRHSYDTHMTPRFERLGFWMIRTGRITTALNERDGQFFRSDQLTFFHRNPDPRQRNEATNPKCSGQASWYDRRPESLLCSLLWSSRSTTPFHLSVIIQTMPCCSLKVPDSAVSVYPMMATAARTRKPSNYNASSKKHKWTADGIKH